MEQEPRNKTSARWRRVRQASLAGVTLAFAVAACTDDAIVYPNRSLHATGGATGEAGALAAAGEAGGESGGASSVAANGGNGASTTGGGSIVDDEAGAGAAGVVGGNGSVCGNGIVEPPEECDDGNTVSGDGCSAQCKSHCETCEAKVCSLADVYDFESEKGPVYDDCYKVTGKVLAGPAQGLPRAQVCSALVDCIRREKCAQPFGPENVRFNRCWCDVDWNDTKAVPVSVCTSPATFVPGRCASQFQDASEGDTASAVVSNLSTVGHALGAAMRLLMGCDEHVCTEECLPEYFGDAVLATITQNLTATRNAAGESLLGDLTADAQRAVAHADAAILVFQGLCQDGGDDAPCKTLAFSATPNRLADADGRVLESEALATQIGYGGVSVNPADNVAAGTAIVTATFTGQQLYDALTEALVGGAPAFVSGLTYTWKDAASLSREVVEIRKDGVPIDRAASFVVALSNFLTPATDGSNKVLAIPELGKGANYTVVPNSAPITLFGQYLSTLPQPVAPPALNRITCSNCSDGSGGSGGSSSSGGNGGN